MNVQQEIIFECDLENKERERIERLEQSLGKCGKPFYDVEISGMTPEIFTTE